MAFDRRTLILPAGTVFEEHTIVSPGDVVVADHCEVEFGLKGEERVYLGESVHVGGHVAADGEVRMDLFTRVEGDVTCHDYCYLGEKVVVGGQLSVDGDLDVGDDVTIEEGFEAKGWINIRGPIPLVIYLFIYLMELLRQGHSQEVERILQELNREQDRIHVGEVFLYVPKGSRLGLQESTVKGNMSVGADCRVIGNFVVEGNVHVGENSQVFGSVRAKGRASLEPGAVVEGDLTCEEAASLDQSAEVQGSLTAQEVEMHHTALVRGRVQAQGGINFVTQEVKEMEAKVERFEQGAPEGVEELLE